MEHLDGITLRALLERAGAQPLERVRTVATGVGAALGAAHAKGFIHRDIKPENIIVSTARGGQESAKLLDFGIAKLLTADRRATTNTGTAMGTPQYMCPEQLEDSAIDHRADIYALGAVIYEMLTGMVPFPGRTQAEVRQLQLTRMPPPPSVARAESRLSRAMDAAVLWALTLDPAARCRRVEDLVSAFLVGYERTLVEQMHPSALTAERTLARGRRLALAIAAGGVAVLGLGGLGLWAYLSRAAGVADPPRHGTTSQPNRPPDAAPRPLTAAELAAEARRRVKQALASPELLDRSAVLDGIARVGKTPFLDEVRAATRDLAPKVSVDAAIALGEIGDARARPELLALLRRSLKGPGVVTVAAALAKLGDETGLRELKRAAKSDNRAERLNALLALARVQDPAAAGLEEFANYSDRHRRMQVLGYLATLGGKAARKDARMGLDRTVDNPKEDWSLRIAAAAALATREADRERATAVLAQALATAPPAQRQRAALQLAQLKDARAVAPLVQSLRSPKVDSETRKVSALALGRLGAGTHQVREALAKALLDPEVALAAAVALLAISDLD
jgi:HEAT repeat protein